MGFLDNFFKTKVTNPVLISAMEAYASNASEENTVDLWQKLMKSKVLLATTEEGRSNFGKIKQIRDAISLPFTTQNSDKGEIQFAVFTDNEALEKFSDSTACVALNGDQVLILAAGKGINALLLNPGSSSHLELRCWQHTVFVDKASDTGKLHALATKFTRAGLNNDAEGVLKAAISVAQKDPGPQHPVTAELNLELARSMRTQGKLTEAEWVYRRALSIYEISGSHDLDVAGTSEALATLYIENKKAGMATPLLTRALEIYENVPGGKPDCIGRILCQLAEIKLDEKNGTEAEQYYKRAALTLEEKNHPDFAAVVNKLGALCEIEQRPKDALANYLRTLSVAENMKRMRPLDIATAAHRAGAIHTAAKQFSEAEPLMNRAMEIYQKEGSTSNLAAIGALFNELAEAKAQAETDRLAEADQQASRPRYGVPGKKPSDLPLLDMSSMKNQPRATYASISPTEEKVKEPLDSEAEALQRMRAFLDNVDQPESRNVNEDLSVEGGAEAHNEVEPVNRDFESPVHSDFESPVRSDFESPPHSDFESPVRSDFESPPHSDFESPVHRDFEPPVGADLETAASSDFEHRTESDFGTKDLFDLEGQVHNDDIAAVLNTSAEAVTHTDLEGLFHETGEQPELGAILDVDAPPKAQTESAESSLLSLLEETLVDDSVGVDELFASTKRNAADAAAAAAAATDVGELIASSKRNAAAAAAACTAADSLSTAIPVVQEIAPSPGADRKIFEKPVDADISAVFNSSMIGPITRDGRYDKPLADRSTAEPPAEAAVPDVSEQKKKNLFDASVAGEISYIFNKSILNEIDKTERYDKPISERIKPFVEEVEAAATKAQESADESSAVFDDADLENSLTDAFKNLLAEPGKSPGADRFDIPISERVKSPPPAADRFDIPISERIKSPPPPPAPVVSREPVPAPAPAPAEQTAEESLFSDTELDDSLTDAFNKLLADPKVGADRFDTPISERVKSAPVNEAKAEQPAVPVVEPVLDQAAENALFSDDELDHSLNDAFNSLLGENKVGTGDRFDVPIAERMKSAPVNERFDTPIAERKKAAPEPQAILEPESVDSENLEGSLNDAFANIFSESKTADDRFDKPIAERNLAPNTVAAQNSATEAEPIPVVKIEESDLAAAKTPEELIRLLELALKADPDNGDLWLRKGTALVQQQKLDEAIKVFDKVTTMCPNDIKAWYCKGSSLHLKNCFEDALYCFNHVLNLDKDNNKAMLRKAECLLKLGRSDQGMAIYDRLLIVQPKFIAGWSSKARALLQQRKLDEALACYEQVLAIDPNNEDATRARNLIATKMGVTAAN